MTYFFYEAEEIEARYNGLTLVSQAHPQWLEADFAVLLEPTYGVVEAGCQGTMRVVVSTTGARAHSARSWRGVQRHPRRRGGAAPAGGVRGAAGGRSTAARTGKG